MNQQIDLTIMKQKICYFSLEMCKHFSNKVKKLAFFCHRKFRIPICGFLVPSFSFHQHRMLKVFGSYSLLIMICSYSVFLQFLTCASQRAIQTFVSQRAIYNVTFVFFFLLVLQVDLYFLRRNKITNLVKLISNIQHKTKQYLIQRSP